MHDAFLRSLLDSPRDDASRLVYADWLEEQDTPPTLLQAEYLRLTVQLVAPGLKKARRKAQRKRLQELAAQFDTDWLAIVSRIPVENCAGKRSGQQRFREMFSFVCDRDWIDMQPTADGTVRHCAQCAQNVHDCGTIQEARDHAQEGHCVAVDLGVIRRERDLEPRLMMLGMPSPGWLDQEARRMELDPVSAERERRKQEARENEAGATNSG